MRRCSLHRCSISSSTMVVIEWYERMQRINLYTGLLLHFQSHTDLRYKRCLIKTMAHRSKELSSTYQAFVDECGRLKSIFHRLGYFSSLVNCIIDNCDYSSTLDAKTKSDETLRVSIPFKDQVSANIVKKQMRDLRSKIGIDVQPIYTSKKLEQDPKLKEIKPRIINQHSLFSNCP